jgi:hypothetical protein
MRILTSAVKPNPQGKAKSSVGFGFALWAVFSLCWLAGCASPRTSAGSAKSLADSLRDLAPMVAPGEATLAAATAFSYSLELAQEYRVMRPAILHNVLVNLGLRKRGLCFQWADDLSAKLQSLNLHTLQMRRGVARLDTRREHSSVVLTATGQEFDEGIVLDAWRHSGRLYWGSVKKDRYPWIEVFMIGGTPENP